MPTNKTNLNNAIPPSPHELEVNNQLTSAVVDGLGELAQKKSHELTKNLEKVTTKVSKEFLGASQTAISDVLRQILGQPAPIDLDPKRSIEKQSDSEFWRKKYFQSEWLRKAEQEIKLSKEQEQIIKIEQVRQVLKNQFINAASNFAVEAEIALEAAKNSKDIYTENFLNQLLNFMLIKIKDMNRATLWLSMHNNRTQKKLPFYMKSKLHMQVDAFSSQERTMNWGG